MASKIVILALFACFITSSSQLRMTEQLQTSDLGRIREVLESPSRLSDACSIYYSVLGLTSLDVEVSDKQKLCTALKELPTTDSESLFCSTVASKKLSCPVPLSGQQISQLKSDLKDKTSVEKLYFSYATLHAQDKVSDVKSSELTATLKEALKQDDSPQSYGYAFHLVSLLSTSDAASFLDYVEDIVAQADEVDGKYLQFSNGLFTTALVVDSSLALADRAGKAAPGLNANRVIQFANYLLSRRFATQVKLAGRLASALGAIAKNNQFRPLSVSISPESTTLSETKKAFRVVVTDVLGRLPKSSVTVTVQSAKHVATAKSLVDNKPMKMNELGAYELEITDTKAESGLYKFNIKISTSDNKWVGITDPIGLEARVVTPITVAAAEFGVVDSDASISGSKLNPATFPNKLSQTFDADYHQKLLMKFQVKDSRLDKLIQVHQAFVRFENVATGREVVFVAEFDQAAQMYKFDLPVNSKAKEFGHLSGEYKMFLIIGDAAIAQSQLWHVANIRFRFVEVPPKAKKIDDVIYKPLPEIKHMFREPEKRPADIVSLAFTALCLAPVLIMFVLWGKVGANISGMEAGLSTLFFHGGIAAIFGLFGCFFLWLDMFSTIKYLAILAVVTFYFGNRVLASLAAKKA